MRLSLLGVNHRTAPVEIRERFAIPESRLAEATERLAHYPGVDEGMIVSTCNRVELFVSSANGRTDLRGFLRDYFKTDVSSYEQHLYEFEERDAVRHLFRVAASLDSMIVGEPQILGQVKEAFAVARGVGAVRSNLNVVVTKAFASRSVCGTRPRLEVRRFQWPRSRWSSRKRYSDLWKGSTSSWLEQGR